MAEAISLDQLRRIAEKDEAGLRADYPDGLPDDWEADLAEHPGDTALSALYRVVVLKSFYRERARSRGGYAAEAADPSDAQAAAHALLRRTPVSVTLASGRAVEVSGRSISCMSEIAAHQLRIRHLDAELGALAAIASRLDRRQPRWTRTGRRTRRLLQRATDLYRRAYAERERHRAQLYAHIFTPSGAPAAPGETAPTWWREIAPEDDAAIMAALLEAGPLRYRRLGETPGQKGRQSERGEDWGFEGLLVSWGIRKKVEPARMLDQDLGQALAEMRLAAPPSLEEELDG